MKTWTVDEMLAEEPCARYTPERVLALWDGRERLSLAEILQLNLPAEDRVWVACRPGALDPAVLEKWLTATTERAGRRAIDVYREPGYAVWAKGWLDGADRGALSAAWAATAAAWAATAAAAAAVQQAAAEAAAWAVTEAARAAGAAAAEREQQVADLLAILDAANQHD